MNLNKLDNLIERLRELDKKGYQPLTGAIGEEAADTIESLRAELNTQNANMISLHYMHDGHVFSRIKGNTLDEIIAYATSIALSEDGAYGMLCSPILLCGKKEIRRINANAHARKMTDTEHWNEQISKWRSIVEADTEFMNLLASGGLNHERE